ncbi:phosphoglycerate kinase [Ventosimonas gracilis]|uniref:Phosphoglycerate kinase n=1 Tax=Ventosimonas gracilis TaxID=1680762 RepID=A0A139SJ38_9GAMM|nr:phosphoglycerate kinase [Ventosimonas gracilis]KXU34567.1 phosphoglycerate kinase [Ventosimonas gracilis]
MTLLHMQDIDLAGKSVLIREDFNVPLKDGAITSAARLEAALPGIRLALDKGAALLLCSHLGRPSEGQFDEHLSLAPVADWLSAALKRPVPLLRDYLDGVTIQAGEVALLENVRFNIGEKTNDDTLAQRYASLCDVFVMDAFGTAHRSEASTVGVAKFAKVACAGPLLAAELNALGKALDNPTRPLTAIVGGSKVSSKLAVLNALSERCDQLIVGGGIANCFLASAGFTVGQSLYEADLIDAARRIAVKVNIPLPIDVVVAKALVEDAAPKVKSIDKVADDEMILDIGPKTAVHFAGLLKDSGTILWNGPVGVFEWAAFSSGTRTLATAIAESRAFSIAGGGDTLAAIDKFGVAAQMSYISTGGGAFLEFVEGKTLPALAALMEK